MEICSYIPIWGKMSYGIVRYPVARIFLGTILFIQLSLAHWPSFIPSIYSWSFRTSSISSFQCINVRTKLVVFPIISNTVSFKCICSFIDLFRHLFNIHLPDGCFRASISVASVFLFICPFSRHVSEPYNKVRLTMMSYIPSILFAISLFYFSIMITEPHFSYPFNFRLGFLSHWHIWSSAYWSVNRQELSSISILITLHLLFHYLSVRDVNLYWG